MSEHHNGFRENGTTTDAAVEMVEEITEAVENDECSIGIYIDLQKASDRRDHI